MSNILTTPSVPISSIFENRDVEIMRINGTLMMIDGSEVTTGATKIVAKMSTLWNWRNGTIPRIVVPNRHISNLLFAEAKRTRAEVATKLSILTSIAASAWYVELDAALSRKESGHDDFTTDDWRRYMGIKIPKVDRALVPVLLMRELVKVCEEGDFTLPQQGLIDQLVSDELSVLHTNDPWRQFAAATNLADSWNAIEISDPEGRERYRFDGTVFDGVITNIDHTGVITLATERTPKNRSGKKLVKLDPDAGYPVYSPIEYSLYRSNIDRDGGVEVVIRPMGMVEHRVGDVLTLMEKPFLMKTMTRRSKWSDKLPYIHPHFAVPPELEAELISAH